MAIVMGLTGLAGSGKSTVAEYLKKRYGFEFLVFSDVLKEEAERRGLLKGAEDLEARKAILSRLGDKWRIETGKNEVLAEKLIEKINQRKLQKVVVDGFRAPEEVKIFRKIFKDFHLVRVEAEELVRWGRRKLEDPKADFEKFKARDRLDIESKGLGTVLKMADLVLDNSDTKEGLSGKIERKIGPLLSK